MCKSVCVQKGVCVCVCVKVSEMSECKSFCVKVIVCKKPLFFDCDSLVFENDSFILCAMESKKHNIF